MSDNFEMLVDTEATVEEAKAVLRAVLARFRKLGLITGKLNRDCVLGGEGYRPGPAVADLYKLKKQESRFWELVTSGVESQIGRGYNEWALGEVCEGLSCPSCGSLIDPFGEPFATAIAKAIGECVNQSGPAGLRCPNCRQTRSIAEWHCKPPLGFGNLSFIFWNWPPLDSPSWKIDVIGIVRESSGHTIIKTHGRI
jgi:hypothetical protein